MSPTAVLVCSGAGIESASAGETTVFIDDLCNSPAAAGQALKKLGATRAVLGLCGEARAPHGLRSALRSAGAEPFGVEAIALSGAANPHGLLAAAEAKLARLSADEPGKPVLSTRPLDRRALFSRNALLDYRPVAVVDEQLCVGSARCGLCADACPTDAIEQGEGYPQIDATACTACATCILRCPTGAIHLSGAAPAQVAAQLEQLLEFADGIVLACANAEGAAAPQGWALLTLPTLALVTVGWILQIRTRGRQVRLLGCGGPCCSAAAGTEAFAQRILADQRWPRPGEATGVPLSEPTATVEACERISTTSESASIEGKESPLGLVELDADRCTLCGVCALSCPTRALQLDESEDRTTLRYEHGTCTGCEQCVRRCPENALGLRRAISPSLLAQGRVSLLGAPHEACTGCGAALPPAPLRRRVGELLPDMAGSHLNMCATCAQRTSVATAGQVKTEEG